MLQDYQTALTKFSTLNTLVKQHAIDTFLLLDYNIGYCHFKLKEYTKASNAFEMFLQKDAILDGIKYDAFTRLGDSYFATTNYKKAIIAYEKVTDDFGIGTDYATYQIGMSYGFINEYEAKIIALKKVNSAFPISNLKDDALYQLGNTYSALKDSKNAHIAYNRLAKKHPKSIFLSRALLRQGLLYFNNNAYKESLIKYKMRSGKIP